MSEMVEFYIWRIIQRIIFVPTYFKPKIMINLKKSLTAIEIASLDKKEFIHMSQSRARIRKLHVHDHMTLVVKIDILTGCYEKDNLHFILKIIFYFKLSTNHAFSQNL